MVAATGASVLAVGHEFFGTQAGFKCCVVQKLGVVDQIFPVVHRLNIDLNHAGVGRDLQHFQARVTRGRVAF